MAIEVHPVTGVELNVISVKRKRLTFDEAVTALKQRGVAVTRAALEVADGAKLKAWIATATG